MSTRDSSNFDDSWLDKSSNEMNDLERLLSEQDAAADDSLDDLLKEEGVQATLDDTWLESGEEVVNLHEKDVIGDEYSAPVGSLDDREFEKWLEETAGGSKAEADELDVSGDATDDDMERWLREAAGEAEAGASAMDAVTGREAEESIEVWADGVADMDAEDQVPVVTDESSEFGDTYVQSSGLEVGQEEFGMEMPATAEGMNLDDEPFDAERMSLEELTGTEAVEAGAEPLDLDAEDELARASAQLSEAFDFDAGDVADEDTGGTGIFYTEDLGDESSTPSLSDDRFPPPDEELGEEERFSFDEPRPRGPESTGNLFERATTGLRERVSDTLGGGAAAEFADIGGGEGAGQNNWLLVALAGIALVAGGSGAWIGMRSGSEVKDISQRMVTLEQRIAKDADLQQEMQGLSGGLDDLRKQVAALSTAATAAPAATTGGAEAGAASRAEIEELQRITENLSDRITSITRSNVGAGGSEGAAAVNALLAEVDGLKKSVAELQQQKAAPESEMQELKSAVAELRTQNQDAGAAAEMAALRGRVDDMSHQLAALAEAAKRAPKPSAVEVKPLAKPELKPEVREAEAAAPKPAAKEPAAAVAPAGELDAVRPAQAEEAAPAATEGQPPKGAFAINLLSINNQKAAIQAQEKLRKDGIETFIRTADIKGATWYRLRAEGFANPQEAKKFLEEHKNHPEFKGAWISKN